MKTGERTRPARREAIRATTAIPLCITWVATLATSCGGGAEEIRTPVTYQAAPNAYPAAAQPVPTGPPADVSGTWRCVMQNRFGSATELVTIGQSGPAINATFTVGSTDETGSLISGTWQGTVQGGMVNATWRAAGREGYVALRVGLGGQQMAGEHARDRGRPIDFSCVRESGGAPVAQVTTTQQQVTAAATLLLNAVPVNPRVGDEIRVRYGLRVQSGTACAAPLHFGGLDVLSGDALPPQMPAGCGGATGIACPEVTLEYRLRASRPGRYAITNAFLVGVMHGTAPASLGAHEPLIIDVGNVAGLPPPPPETPPAPTPLQVGVALEGALQPGDRTLPDGSLAHDYSVALTAGQPATFVVRGGPSTSTPGARLDMYARLLINDTEVVHDDDSAGDQNSRIVFQPQQTGVYTLRVSTFGPCAKSGHYAIQSWPGAVLNAN